MHDKIYIPKKIKEHLEDNNYNLDNIGKSNSIILLYKNQVLKIEEKNYESDHEHKILKWLEGRLNVPKVICSYSKNDKNYLLMTKLNGNMACSEKLMQDPIKLIKTLAKGINLLKSVNVKDYPYISSLDKKLELAKYDIENNLVDISDSEKGTYGPNGFKDPYDLLKFLISNKPNISKLYFTHGDYCLPNIFIDDDYNICGFIDLGRAEVGDIYNDIALCIRSLEHNLGTNKYNQLLFDELKMEYDKDLIRYYILLDELF